MLGIRHRLPSIAERIALGTGFFDASNIDWTHWRRLVFVCTGNICRSPFAEGFARMHGLAAVSCGVDTRSDFPADPSAIAEAARRGVDLTAHRTTRWLDLELEPADLVVAIQLKHAYATHKRASAAGARVILMSSLLPDFQIVRDPYGREMDVFASTFEQIERAVLRIREKSQPPNTQDISGISDHSATIAP